MLASIAQKLTQHEKLECSLSIVMIKYAKG